MARPEGWGGGHSVIHGPRGVCWLQLAVLGEGGSSLPVQCLQIKAVLWKYTLIHKNQPGKGGVEGEMRPGEGTTDLKSPLTSLW